VLLSPWSTATPFPNLSAEGKIDAAEPPALQFGR
jgi:hypothetical protein